MFIIVGLEVGLSVGEAVGLVVGDTVGDAVGLTVGDTVGDAVGLTVGEAVVGDTVGLAVGEAVGEAVGDTVGDTVVVVVVPADLHTVLVSLYVEPDVNPPWLKCIEPTVLKHPAGCPLHVLSLPQLTPVSACTAV